MKTIVYAILATSLLGSFVSDSSAQIMGGFTESSTDWNQSVEHTLREEKEGKEIWDKFQAKEVACGNLNDEQFGALGEYFMGRMAGESHTSMNTMMIRMHGEEGEEKIHTAMGKRLSGCDASATASGMGNWVPMMWWSSYYGTDWSNGPSTGNTNDNPAYFDFGGMTGMMGGMFAYGLFFLALIALLISLAFAAIFKWIWRRGGDKEDALEILKSRYAKGEITKEQFESMKKDIQK